MTIASGSEIRYAHAMRALRLSCLLVVLAACGDPSAPEDAGRDGGSADAAPSDSGPTDAGPGDGGATDATVSDADVDMEGGTRDAGPIDAGPDDAGAHDASTADGTDGAIGADAGSCDSDGDGALATLCGGDDCDDGDADVHPGASERWIVELVAMDGEDPSLVFDAAGVRHVAYSPPMAEGVRVASDASGSFVSVSASTTGAAPSLVVMPDGRRFVAYREATAGPEHHMRVAVEDGAGAWTHEDVARDILVGVGAGHSLATDGSTLALAYMEADADFGRLVYAARGAAGWTSTPAIEAGRTGLEPQLTFVAGAPFVAYHTLGLGPRVATLVGASFIEEAVETTAAVEPSIARTPSGEVELAYHLVAARDLRHATRSATGWTVTTLDSAGDTGRRPALSIDASGHRFIAYFYADATVTYRVRLVTDASGTFRTFEIDPAAQPRLGPRVAIALAPSGLPHVAYHDTPSGELRIASPDAVDRDCDGSPL